MNGSVFKFSAQTFAFKNNFIYHKYNNPKQRCFLANFIYKLLRKVWNIYQKNINNLNTSAKKSGLWNLSSLVVHKVIHYLVPKHNTRSAVLQCFSAEFISLGGKASCRLCKQCYKLKFIIQTQKWKVIR